MLTLSGKNLGERQKELNAKVNEAALNNVDFEEIKAKAEQSDIDHLFKIDLASKYRNIDYIIEVLKLGDSLHISRALKSVWMFDDEYSHIINVDYLHHNVFPHMSIKMKKKFLTAIASNVKNEDRTIAFYNYCMDKKLTNAATKFVIYTNDAFKLELLKKKSSIIFDIAYADNINHFLGTSFTLTDAYLVTLFGETSKVKAFKEISYLYTVSDIQYLDMLEKHVSLCNERTSRLGLRFSKDIITKHKHRVLSKPCLYINFLNKATIVKHSSSEDVKIYLRALLPNEVTDFWNCSFCDSYEYIINKLPAEERFGFLKNIYNDKYPEEPFEMVVKFYTQKYYRFMTSEQKEKWALDQIASQKEILGPGNDFKWYKFINFDKAFDEIKKYVMITTNVSIRSEMLNVLIDSAKTQRDLEKLFRYYYDRHNNERQHVKEDFMSLVANIHNIFEFDNDCWEACNKIYQNLDVYSMSEYNKGRNEFKIIALIYHIINNMDVHDALKLNINNSINFYILKQNTNKLPKEKQDMVFEYLFKFYMDKIIEFDSSPYQENSIHKLTKYNHNILDLLHKYNRTKQDIPEVVMNHMKMDWDEYKYHKLLFQAQKKTTQADLIRLLKKDAEIVVESLPEVKDSIEHNYRFLLGQFLKKVKIYFPNDLTKELLKFYNDLLAAREIRPSTARASCYGIFQLGENSYKVEFMTKHAPTESKINRAEIDESLLHIQEAICATAYYSRPPVPLKTMLLYVKGDYVPHCLSMFNSYLANLPLPMCMEFVEALLNNPVSIQKHGLRLAFACFNTENLNKLVSYVWKRTKNVSLRVIIYKALHSKICNEDENAQITLFETFRTFTLTLHQDDDQEVFDLNRFGQLPVRFISDYIDAAWKAVSALPKNKINQERVSNIIDYMCNKLNIIRQEIIQPIVEKIIKDDFDTKELMEANVDSNSLGRKKWDFVAHYITIIQDKDDLENKVVLVKLIFNQFFSRFNLVAKNSYVIRKFSNYFIYKVLNISYLHSYDKNLECFEYLNTIFDTILQIIESSTSIEDMYMIIWAIKINKLARKALININTKLNTTADAEKYAIVKSGLLDYGKDMGNLIQEFIKKDLYFTTFWPNIQQLFISETQTITLFILKCKVKPDDSLVIACLALMKFQTTAHYLFALNVLPSQYNRQFGEEYASILNELKQLTTIEIKCKMYEKFVHSDFQLRSFLQL